MIFWPSTANAPATNAEMTGIQTDIVITSYHLFVKDNIWIDDNNSRINIPFFLKEYLFDLNNDENKMINIFLKEIYKDPFMYKEYRKMEIKMSAGKIFVRYYKEYDKPNRNV